MTDTRSSTLPWQIHRVQQDKEGGECVCVCVCVWRGGKTVTAVKTGCDVPLSRGATKPRHIEGEWAGGKESPHGPMKGVILGGEGGSAPSRSWRSTAS